MSKKLPYLLGLALLGWANLPVWAQISGLAPLAPFPVAQPTPPPVQLNVQPQPKPEDPGKPADSPPPNPPPTTSIGIYPEMMASGEGCCDQQRSFWSGTFSAGGGAYYLVPFFGSNPAYYTKSGSHTNESNFGTNGDAAPTAFLSYTLDSGLGVQAHWFNINTGTLTQSSHLGAGTGIMDAGGTSLGTASAAGANANAGGTLDMYVIDLEITQKWFCGNAWWLQFGGGIRYARIDENYQLNVNDAVNGHSTSIANHGFTGWGPTVSFEFHRKLCDDSGFGLYGTLRGSLLFCSTDQNYSVASTNATVTPTSGSGSSAGIIPVGEAELGVEYTYAWGRLHVFGQLGASGQIWGGGGSSSEGSGLAPGSLGTQNSAPSSFGFIGGVARVGFCY